MILLNRFHQILTTLIVTLMVKYVVLKEQKYFVKYTLQQLHTKSLKFMFLRYLMQIGQQRKNEINKKE